MPYILASCVFADVCNFHRLAHTATAKTYFVYFTCPSPSGIRTLQNTNELHLLTIETHCQNQYRNGCHSPVYLWTTSLVFADYTTG